MKTPRRQAAAPQSATSLPLAPADDAGTRMRNYLLTMGIRIACLVLMVFVTPYGWYSFVFASGAVFLPYIAVVIANAASGRSVAAAQDPAIALEAPSPAAPQERSEAPTTIIRLAEASGATDARPVGGDGHPEDGRTPPGDRT